MRKDSCDSRWVKGLLRCLALGVLTVAVISPLAGCELEVRSNDDPSLGDAFSDVGRATENTWDDFEDWWNDRF